MKKVKITGKYLRSLGYPESPVISQTMQVIAKHYKHASEEEINAILVNIITKPEDFLDDALWTSVASSLVPTIPLETDTVALRTEQIPYEVYGKEFIEEGAIAQMNNASRLPISVAGALMPDAHQGYGLPIGGVLATEQAVIPFGVGVDIGCRMCLSIFDINPKLLQDKENYFAREILENTRFGAGNAYPNPHDHEVLSHPLFDQDKLIKSLKDKAWRQLGTSGSGNHFVEFGALVIDQYDEVLGVAPGAYIGLLSHSGSRALGANIANHYTRLAKEITQLPKEVQHLAWLSLDTEEGNDYWNAMNLAGDYSSACHHIIHSKIARQLGEQPIKMVENHHNFAWKEIWKGKEVIVHRKGATPAGKDVLGFIPGSMTANGYLVKGLGNESSINSAAHGSGRKMSRTKALSSITKEKMNAELKKYGVKLLGAGLDEAPFAYKDINDVMNAQQELVSILGTFTPKIVKMDGTPPRHNRSKKGGIIDGE